MARTPPNLTTSFPAVRCMALSWRWNRRNKTCCWISSLCGRSPNAGNPTYPGSGSARDLGSRLFGGPQGNRTRHHLLRLRDPWSRRASARWAEHHRPQIPVDQGGRRAIREGDHGLRWTYFGAGGSSAAAGLIRRENAWVRRRILSVPGEMRRALFEKGGEAFCPVCGRSERGTETVFQVECTRQIEGQALANDAFQGGDVNRPFNRGSFNRGYPSTPICYPCLGQGPFRGLSLTIVFGAGASTC